MSKKNMNDICNFDNLPDSDLNFKTKCIGGNVQTYMDACAFKALSSDDTACAKHQARVRELFEERGCLDKFEEHCSAYEKECYGATACG